MSRFSWPHRQRGIGVLRRSQVALPGKITPSRREYIAPASSLGLKYPRPADRIECLRGVRGARRIREVSAMSTIERQVRAAQHRLWLNRFLRFWGWSLLAATVLWTL